jgi:hypothetical protein
MSELTFDPAATEETKELVREILRVIDGKNILVARDVLRQAGNVAEQSAVVVRNQPRS